MLHKNGDLNGAFVEVFVLNWAPEAPHVISSSIWYMRAKKLLFVFYSDLNNCVPAITGPFGSLSYRFKIRMREKMYKNVCCYLKTENMLLKRAVLYYYLNNNFWCLNNNNIFYMYFYTIQICFFTTLKH